MSDKDLPSTSATRSLPNYSHLLTPLYAAAVAGLLLNDFVLKKAIPGFMTGKLSDFLGLFAFAVFWSVVFPRWTKSVHLLVAIAFVAWKSPLSEPFIQSWNGFFPLTIARIVDYSDLIALSVLPISILYLAKVRRHLPLQSVGTTAVAAVSLFAFTATSQLPIEQAKFLSRDGKYEHAIRAFDEIIRANPGDADALYHRGLAKLKTGDTAGGEADIAMAGSIDPKYKP